MSDLLTFANSLADAAASVTTRYFGAGVEAITKVDQSPVTIADKEAESAMRALIGQHFPSHGIWGEEGERINPDAAVQWVLDPIDGTRAFMAGYSTFTTLIACVEHGSPMFGVVDQPILKQRFVGAKGKPSTLNGSPIKVSQATNLSGARIATTSTYYFNPTQRAWFDSLAVAAKSYVLGGDAYAYAMLASGKLDVVVDVGLKYYDLAALIPLVEGAGGVIRVSQHGECFDVVATSTDALLNQVISI
jgi:inositol-phosphate phosphatase / L-galactose 1-phosphate phosphatase / histidinol-phosphatase